MTLTALVVVILAVTAALVYNRVAGRPRQASGPRVPRRRVHGGNDRAAGVGTAGSAQTSSRGQDT